MVDTHNTPGDDCGVNGFLGEVKLRPRRHLFGLFVSVMAGVACAGFAPSSPALAETVEGPSTTAPTPPQADQPIVPENAAEAPEQAGEETEADANEREVDEATKKAEAAAKEAEAVEALCTLMMGAAQEYSVPADFFIRLIWKESRFNPNAVSPVGAQGIAQFMPSTARIRGLEDPFDSAQALPASAAFLRELKDRFGSWGLAAAGYNGGPNRIPPFLAGQRTLPYETVAYVFSITGRSVDYWRGRARSAAAIEPPRQMPATTGTMAEDTLIEPWSPTPASPAPRPLRRPDVAPASIHCPTLVARLGRSRDISPPSNGTWTRWGAQVAGHTSRNVAMRQYARIKSRLPEDLVAVGPRVIVRRFAARGRRPIHAVQFAAANQREAQALCRRISQRLAPCVVVRNG